MSTVYLRRPQLFLQLPLLMWTTATGCAVADPWPPRWCQPWAWRRQISTSQYMITKPFIFILFLSPTVRWVQLDASFGSSAHGGSDGLG